MIELGLSKREFLKPLCADSREVLVRAGMEGTMGRAWIPTFDSPSFCLILAGRFAYLIGIPPHGSDTIDLFRVLSRNCGDAEIVPEDERWCDWIEKVFAGRFRTVSRYQLELPEDAGNREKLVEIIEKLPDGFVMHPFDTRLYRKALENSWSENFVRNFESEEQFRQFGMGTAVLDGSRLVSGCTAGAFSHGMMEVHAATAPEYRRRGLAECACASFLSACLEKKLRPVWDTSSYYMVKLAEKLGCRHVRDYDAYEIAVEEF